MIHHQSSQVYILTGRMGSRELEGENKRMVRFQVLESIVAYPCLGNCSVILADPG